MNLSIVYELEKKLIKDLNLLVINYLTPKPNLPYLRCINFHTTCCSECRAPLFTHWKMSMINIEKWTSKNGWIQCMKCGKE